MSGLVDVRQDGGIATVALNRPEAYNAFNLEMITDLAQHLTRLATDQSVKGILLCGEGNAFCAGGDLKWVVQFSERHGSSFHTLAAQLHLAITEIRRMEKPVVAAVHGAAAGAGFSLALACDFRVLEESATMKQAYTSNGLSIDGGGSFILPRIVGLARALEIAAFDDSISAQQAVEWGLATTVVADGTARTEAARMLGRLIARSLHSFGWAKRLLNDAFGNSFEYHLEIEREGLSACADHPDGREGLRAFVEKRKPVFPGSPEGS